MLSYQYGDSHFKDKKVSRLHDGNLYTWKDGLYNEMGHCFLESVHCKLPDSVRWNAVLPSPGECYTEGVGHADEEGKSS